MDNIFSSEFSETTLIILLVVIFYTLTLKGAALWLAARNKQKGWFIALLLLNTLGILPIVYILIDRLKKKSAKIDESKKETK